MRTIAILVFGFMSMHSVAATNHKTENHVSTLYKYAQTSCLFWYFKKQNFDTKDIRAISGGIIETSNISLDKFTEISLFLKNYSPTIPTKNNIDTDLNKCFHLEKSEKLRELIYQ